MFDSFTGESYKCIETNLFQLPTETDKLMKYMEAYCKKLVREPMTDLGMTISSERMLNRQQSDHYKEGDLF